MSGNDPAAERVPEQGQKRDRTTTPSPNLAKRPRRGSNNSSSSNAAGEASKGIDAAAQIGLNLSKADSSSSSLWPPPSSSVFSSAGSSSASPAQAPLNQQLLTNIADRLSALADEAREASLHQQPQAPAHPSPTDLLRRVEQLEADFAEYRQASQPRDRAANDRLFKMDIRLDRLDPRLGKQDVRFDKIDARINRQDSRLDKMNAAITELRGRLGAAEGRSAALEATMARLNAAEGRFAALEATMARQERDIVSLLNAQTRAWHAGASTRTHANTAATGTANANVNAVAFPNATAGPSTSLVPRTTAHYPQGDGQSSAGDWIRREFGDVIGAVEERPGQHQPPGGSWAPWRGAGRGAGYRRGGG
ncbi:d69d3b1e-ed71-43e2-b5cf-048b0bfb20be [Thermothielavioides terrestris]|uniref:D69d3b1e-ed71-43e2-b5cf-048b0bfb20be n=1 Tax=Thermothielavioides terrestris TaxID=2587410 RepID=A0A3S4F1W7_9PEZI|nr:d69d3b1e-ed71-43e2-b5cf-048b0bfb20be [Thermothielavioides terrestris]